jgi:hypothetical protein
VLDYSWRNQKYYSNFQFGRRFKFFAVIWFPYFFQSIICKLATKWGSVGREFTLFLIKNKLEGKKNENTENI